LTGARAKIFKPGIAKTVPGTLKIAPTGRQLSSEVTTASVSDLVPVQGLPAWTPSRDIGPLCDEAAKKYFREDYSAKGRIHLLGAQINNSKNLG